MAGRGRVLGGRAAAVAAVAMVAGPGVAVAGGDPPVASGALTSRVSVSTDGRQAGQGSFDPAVSARGRYVAFDSLAPNLVDGDTNGTDDVFVRDRLTGVTRLVSAGPGATQGNGSSRAAAVSRGGRFVAFESSASNLVTGDANGFSDVFVHDLLTGVNRLVSAGSRRRPAEEGSYAPAVSGNARVVAFTSFASNLVVGDTNGESDVFVRDLAAGVTRRVSVGARGAQADSRSFFPAVSRSGRFVAFTSEASNLVAGDTNGVSDVFVRDRATRTTRRVSVGPGGRQGDAPSADRSAPALSGSGRLVAFASEASNLVAGDTNGVRDVFVRDRRAGVTRRVSVGAGGRQGGGASGNPAVSGDGRFVAFDSEAPDLVAGDTNNRPDVFVRDLVTGVTRRVSVGPEDRQGDEGSFFPAVSGNGRTVAFTSGATTLVPGDTNATFDVFARDGFGDAARARAR